MRPALLLLAFTAASTAQVSPERDVVLDGRSVVGRWQAIEVVGDAAATADLRRGLLSTVLVVNPTGHAILRGEDRRGEAGRPTRFTGYVHGDRLRLPALAGEAELALYGRRLHLVDPRGRRTVFVRER